MLTSITNGLSDATERKHTANPQSPHLALSVKSQLQGADLGRGGDKNWRVGHTQKQQAKPSQKKIYQTISTSMASNETAVDLPPEVLARIPQTTLCSSALSLAWQTVQRPIFNHSVRVFLAARWLAEKQGSEWAQPDKLPLLFVACICHDLGTSDNFNGPQRFEVEGADAAQNHCQSHGVSQQDSHKVWTAIAIHTSPGIAERIDPFSRLVRFGVMMDFSLATRDELGADELFVELEKKLPRLDIERVLADAVVNQANEGETSQPTDNKSWFSTHKFPMASWPGVLLRARLQNPDHVGRNPAF